MTRVREAIRPAGPRMLIDTHCHLTYDPLSSRLDDVLSRAAEAGISRVITVATTPADARAGHIAMATRPAMYQAAGIHPHEAAKVDDAALAELATLHRGDWPIGALQSRVVAVGETGLDFHYDFAPPDRQEHVFRFQLSLAVEVGRPVVIHARKAEVRVCDILRDYPALAGRVVFHCFSGGPDLARRVLDDGHWLSFTGVATFENGGDIRASARLTPSDRIMVETDAPYLSPEPVRKARPCEPAMVAHTARRLAQERDLSFERFASLTTANAERFFAIPPVAANPAPAGA